MNDKVFAQQFAHELDMETPSTLKCLERIPPELYSYKPHERSMEMGYLTLLVAEIPLWIALIIEQGEIDFATYQHREAKTTQQIVDHFHDNIAKAKNALSYVEDGLLEQPFYLKRSGEILLQSTKREQIESTINHMVHHRGQLTVYMRLNNIDVPSIYGPSADDRSYGGAQTS
ncbi:damage-inducible protein DinB [Mucilaginibacter sp. 21P]|uniref:DinB family protein n=1 Tax=Mucilaginibacter sp. 21P TaxID=2778902 RepID=UPI001C597EFC|nr:DinB family protein [Mucilaginibacter sp. 21P]QXV65000.1 damage-inducible protein DinB [Mucilaginibacter sp. 21P]